MALTTGAVRVEQVVTVVVASPEAEAVSGAEVAGANGWGRVPEAEATHGCDAADVVKEN
jgi:hypothetical protein